MPGLDIAVLGPLAVEVDGEPVVIRRRQERCLLAVLALEANRAVAIDRLTTLIWAEEPPARPAQALQAMISHLRRALRAGDGDGWALNRQGHAYQLSLPAAATDWHRFRSLVQTARTLQNPAQRGDLLVRACRMWRGRMLPELADPTVRERVCGEAEALRASAEEQLLQDWLDCGRHPEVIDRARWLAEEYPLAETPACLHLLALYRCGRRAEALQLYRRIRSRWVSELGLEPGERLRELHAAILSGDAGLRHEVSHPLQMPRGPRQLPRDLPIFVGRGRELAHLDAAALGCGAALTVISGSAGTGKTALAVHWAHTVRHLFPDGQLFVQFRGHSGTRRVEPVVALSTCLQALNVAPDHIPRDVDTASALLRTLTADRRILMVIDDAARAEDVRLLLPGESRCCVVVTSRHRLTDLLGDGARQLTLDVMSEDESLDLLVAALGPDRVAGQTADVVALASTCSGLPLALRKLAARLQDHPDRTLGEELRRLVAPATGSPS